MTLTKLYKLHVRHVHALPHPIMRLSLSLLFAGLLAGASASNVLDLVPDNFDSVIGNGKPGLVEL